MQPYIDEIVQQQKNYQRLPGVELNIDLDPCQKTISEHHANSYEINTQKKLLSDASQNSVCPDQSIQMSYNHIPWLYHLTTIKLALKPSVITTYTLKISPETILIIDNHKISVKNFINAGKRVLFHSLNRANTEMTIKINGVPGVLDATNGSLKLQYSSIINPH